MIPIRILFILSLSLSSIAWAEGETKPVIESLEGDGLVVVKSSNGTSKQAARGIEIQVGDRVKTGPEASAKIRYPDGSKLLVGRGTEVEIQEHNGDTQFNKVYSGYVRGLIRKASQPDKSKPPRFIIRSRTVVMGVRGTDFLLDQKKDLEIHTLDGVVEVAQDEKALMAGKGVSVPRGQMIDADEAKIHEPKPFNREQFEEALAQAQPDMNSMAQKDPEAFRAAQEVGAETKPDLEQQKAREQEHEEKTEKKSKEEAEKNAAPRPRWVGALFQVGPIVLSQQNSGKLVSGELSWTPLYRLVSILSIRGNLGAFPATNHGQGSVFLALEAGANLVVALFNETLLLEPGFSWKRWDFGRNADNDTSPVAQASIRFGDHGLIERVFAAYTEYNGLHDQYSQNIRTRIYKAGVGLRF